MSRKLSTYSTTVSYSPAYVQCHICGEWYCGIYSSSDPNYKPHICSQESIKNEIAELTELLNKQYGNQHT